jgi:ribonucleoside-diphosphate reductase alpha chain
MYTYQEVYEKSLEYFKGDDLAANVWISKYCLKNGDQYMELTPDDMHHRLATEFCSQESEFGTNALFYDEILDLFKDFKYIIPQGSVMSMLGNPYQLGSLSNCIVLPKLYDSYGGIMYADQQLTQLFKRRCGVGLDISTLRPNGVSTNNSAGNSTGAVSFMERFSNTTREVAQDGRRGALMITIDVRHPDIEEFIQIKQDLNKVTGANISIRLTDDFMQAVEDNSDYLLSFPCGAYFPTDSSFPGTLDLELNKLYKFDSGYYKKVKAKELWDKIVKAAHTSAEPGLIFWDTQNEYCPSQVYPGFENISTNPCSEIAMGNDSCRLIAMNMYSYVNNPFTPEANFSYNLWYDHVKKAMRLMDDLVELELKAIDKILEKITNDSEPEYIKDIEAQTWIDLKKSGKEGRRTGLGFTGLGDTLAALGLKYDSEEALDLIEQIMSKKLEAELDSTIQLAEERGTFPAWNNDLEFEQLPRGTRNGRNEFFQFLSDYYSDQVDKMEKVGRRNISWSTVAPTGSLSILAGVTSGIEPLFQPYYTRRKKINPNDANSRVDFTDKLGDKWQEFTVLHSKLKEWISKNIVSDTIDVNNPTSKDIEALVLPSPYNGSCANDINWENRVKLQAIVQKYTTHSISSTINLPNDVSIDEVSNIYFSAWKNKLKGITVYRDGCRSGVLVTNKDTKEEFSYKNAPKRPKVLPCNVHHVKVKGTEYIVCVGLFNNLPYEVFALTDFEIQDGKGTLTKLSKGRYELCIGDICIGNIVKEMSPEEETITRLLSTSLRHGADIKFITQQLDKTSGSLVNFEKAISRVLKTYIGKTVTQEDCPNCGEKLIQEGGCVLCKNCGEYNKCS